MLILSGVKLVEIKINLMYCASLVTVLIKNVLYKVLNCEVRVWKSTRENIVAVVVV